MTWLPLTIPKSVLALEKQNAEVIEALTGDTVRLKGGKTLKYIGVSSPPLQSVIPLVRQYGQEALDFNRSLVESRTVTIEWGSQLRDDRGNLLGYVFLEDGSFVNDRVLVAGHGKAVIQPPNVKYAGTLRRSELQARRDKRGLWKQEPENPFIKSEYIGEKNTKIYYFPTSPELERIPEANLVKFDSRVAAKAAGYRACNTCREGEHSFYEGK